ncbi:MAG: 1-acyl-sn-glycerol-3-phosphate acyltransferase [bacterium]|nr:MAG: 1-acyl-sn-glycerol-3-phosphate acyltransferase [bacterium]
MLYEIAKLIISPFFNSYIRLDIVGHKNIPRSGGVILAPNHISYLDPILLGVAIKRKVYSMAKGELFKNAILRFVMTHLKAFPVKRGRMDRYALKRSLQILNQGKVLNMFPEGTIPLNSNTIEGKPGVVWLALKANVPVVPVKITGSDKLLPDGKVFPKMGRARIVFGQPISFETKDNTYKKNKKRITEKIMEEIEKL